MTKNKPLMYHLTLLAGVCLMLLTTGCAAFSPEAVATDRHQIKAGDYRLDKRHGTLLFKVQHMGLAPYLGRFNDFDIVLHYDPANPAASRVSALVKTASIDVNYPAFSKTLIGPQWFDSGNYPEATFTSTGIEWRDANHATLSGELTLLGFTAPVTLDVEFVGAINHVLTGIYTLGFSATMAFDRSVFGLDRHIPLVSDRVEVEIHGELQQR